MHQPLTVRHAAVLVALCVLAGSARAQQAAAAPPSTAPEVGTIAPDFSLPAVTRFGILRDSVHLADFRGKTVVLAFFYRARTKG